MPNSVVPALETEEEA